MMKQISSKQRWWLLICVSVIWFSNLEYRTLIKPDEGRYAEIPREMVSSGDWVTPRLNALKYFEKPPLQYWATATAYTVFGEHQWTSRLWAGLTGFAGLFLVWFTGRRLFDMASANYAAMILSSSMLYVMMSHINTLDMGVTFFITLGIFSFMLGQQENIPAKTSRNWMLLAWAGLALAVLSKGLMGIILPGTAVFIYCLVRRDFTVLKRMHCMAGLAVFMAICAPWFYLVMKANPEFFEKFFIYEHYTRFTTKELGRYQPWYYFVPVLLIGALPWTLVLFDALLRSGQPVSQNKFNPPLFLLIWTVFIYIFFSISDSKLPSYLLPMFPAFALLIGHQIATMREKLLFWYILPVVPFAVLLQVAGFNAGWFASTPNQMALYPHYSIWLVSASIIWLAGLTGGMALLWRGQKFVAVLLIAMTTLLSIQIGVSGYNTIARERSAKHIAEAIRTEVTPDIPFYSVKTYEQTLPFYLKRTFTLVEYQDEMGFGIKQQPTLWIPTIEAFATVWAAQPRALAIMQVSTYPQLQQLGFKMKIIFADTQHIVVKKP
jgi:4-amino-4-deoxy-L-arabinose transferase-like glycosyltransferase